MSQDKQDSLTHLYTPLEMLLERTESEHNFKLGWNGLPIYIFKSKRWFITNQGIIGTKGHTSAFRSSFLN